MLFQSPELEVHYMAVQDATCCPRSLMAHPSPVQALPTTPMEAVPTVVTTMVTLECTMMTL